MTNEKPSRWLEANEIKEKIDLELVLQHFGALEGMSRRGPVLTGLSPFREETTPSFTVNLAKRVWNDLGGRPVVEGQTVPGNSIGLVMAFASCGFREALEIATDKFVGGSTARIVRETRRPVADTFGPRSNDDSRVLVPESSSVRPTANIPYGKEFRGLIHKGPYLEGKGLDEKWCKKRGIGYQTRGIMKGRVVFPVRNKAGEIVFYIGRGRDDAPDGKWKIPPDAHRSLELYGVDRVASRPSANKAARDYGLVVVEGVTDAEALMSRGFENVVATLGAEVSEEQVELLLDKDINPTRRVTIMFDRDEGGQQGKRALASALIHRAFVRYARWDALPAGPTDPDELSSQQLRAVLALSPTAGGSHTLHQ